MKPRVHLVDGTYELFRQYYGAPKSQTTDGVEVGATRAMLRTLLQLVEVEGATHIGVAFDQVIESFRNDLFAGYKTGAGIDPDLWAQFGPAEEAARALGVVVWPMVEFEADDALAAAAAAFRGEASQVLICTPDKDMAQCVRGDEVVLRDRRRDATYDVAGVREKWGVSPASIPDWLALVGDAADGIPGIPKWGAKSAAAVLARYEHIDRIPADAADWDIKVRGAAGLAATLADRRDDALLYRTLATLREDAPIPQRSLAELEWRGADRDALTAVCERLEFTRFLERVPRWRSS